MAAVELVRPTRSVVIWEKRPEIIKRVQETGVHPVCILRTLWYMGVKPAEAKTEDIEKALEECKKRGAYVAVHKFFMVTPPTKK